MLKTARKQAPFYAGYETEYIIIPTRPDVEAIISIPHETVYRNISAQQGANITRLVQDMDEPLGFQILHLKLL